MWTACNVDCNVEIERAVMHALSLWRDRAKALLLAVGQGVHFQVCCALVYNIQKNLRVADILLILPARQ